MDTVALARREIQQDHCECDVTYEGEAGLHENYKDCSKNKGHLNFVPVSKFNVDDLPAGCQDNDIVILVGAMSGLTVRVTATYVSEKRPETVSENGKPFPYYMSRGKRLTRVGTGWVWAVNKYPKENDKHKTCECAKCMNSPTPETQFANIHIITAAHIVYDNEEGVHTTCHLFFDEGDTPADCSGVVTLSGMSRVWANISEDWCRMMWATHDLDLADRLERMVSLWQSNSKRVKDKYVSLQYSRCPSETISNKWYRLTIIVSHPHGCSKQVSVGFYTEKHMRVGGVARYKYTTCTCNGSSGAYVIVLGRSAWVWFENLVHSGTNGQSYSSYSSDSVLVH